MDYIIYPYEGVGPIRFGMTPEQVREKLGEPNRTTMKGVESPEFPTDAYNDLGFHVFYGKSGGCEFVEFYGNGSANLMFQGQPLFREPFGELECGQTLFGRSFGELESLFQSLETDVQDGDCGLTFLKFGISLYSENYYGPHQNPDCLVEAVGIFASGYYDKDETNIGYPREEAIS